MDSVTCRRCGAHLGTAHGVSSGGTVTLSRFECKCGATGETTYHPQGWGNQ